MGAEKLMRVLILQLYFPDFARLLYDRSQDPIKEFFEYVHARGILQRSEPTVEIAEFLKNRGLVGIEPGPAGLMALDKSVLEEFPPLVRHPEFSALIESFRDDSERRELLDRIQRRPPPKPAEDSAPRIKGVATPKQTRLKPLRIAWVDDKPEGNIAVIRDIEARYGRVTQIEPRDVDEALKELKPDVLISNIRRGDDDSAGLDALKRIRAEKIYTGPAIFFTGRITTARREQAEQLDTAITSDPETLANFLSKLGATAEDAIANDASSGWTPSRPFRRAPY